jgi:hypothetical protein
MKLIQKHIRGSHTHAVIKEELSANEMKKNLHLYTDNEGNLLQF